MGSEEVRQRICEAAMRVAGREGLVNVTLENVATEAGMSKGGVIHHFRTKEKLLEAVVGYFASSIESGLTRIVAEDSNPRMKWVRGMVRLCYPESTAVQDSPLGFPISSPSTNQFMMSVMAASLLDRNLLEPIKQIGEQLRYRLLSEPEDRFDQLLLWLAVDGLFLWEFVGMLREDDPLHKQLIEEIRIRCAIRPPSPELPAEKRSGRKSSPKKSTVKKAANSAVKKPLKKTKR